MWDDIRLAGHQQARVWLEDRPECRYLRERLCERVGIDSADSGHGPPLNAAAVEVTIPLGGVAMYGLLGARFVSAEFSRIEVWGAQEHRFRRPSAAVVR